MEAMGRCHNLDKIRSVGFGLHLSLVNLPVMPFYRKSCHTFCKKSVCNTHIHQIRGSANGIEHKGLVALTRGFGSRVSHSRPEWASFGDMESLGSAPMVQNHQNTNYTRRFVVIFGCTTAVVLHATHPQSPDFR